MNYRFLSVAVIVLISMTFLSCSKKQEVVETVSFKEDTVFKVNGIEVSWGEWNLYAMPSASEIDKLYGKEIWNFKMDNAGRLFGEALRDDIQKRIVTVKLIASKAGELGISLDEDEKGEILLKTDEYMSGLTKELKEKYEITKEVVEQVYTDNKLATKVYEQLILNVDTETDEAEVRHMVLDFIMFSKSYENREGETVFYTDEEIERKRILFADIRKKASESDKYCLKDFESDELVVTEIIADLKELKERLPEEEAGVVFWLRKNELSPLIETEEAIFLFECKEVTEEDSTNAARIKVIESREQQVFDESYELWIKDVKVENNDELWSGLASSFN